MAQETGPWTEYQPTAPADDGPWSEYASVPEKKPGIARKAADLGLSVAKGVVGVPESAVGLADIVSGGRTGKFLENEGGTVGFRPKQAKEYLGSLQSESFKGQQQEFADADGILAKTGAALTNPALIANTVAESAPLMLGGGAVARGVGKVAPSLAGRVGTTAAGEGAVMAGSQAEQIRQETDDGLLTPKQAALAAGTGVIGAGLGVAGARAARALGVGDVDQMIAQGVTQGVARPGLGIANRAGRGALTEGVFEELPQSLAETGLQNIALDRPVTEGMTDAAVLGTLAGGAMGGGAGVVSGMGQSRQTATEQPGQPEADPFTPAPEMAADPLTGEIAAPPQEQATAGLPADSEQVSAPAAPLQDAGITDITPIRETQTPSQAMGIDPNAGPLSKAAATAVDTGVSQEMQAQQAAQEMAQAEQEAAKIAARQRPKAESPSIDKAALETRTDEELRGFLRSAQNADVRKAVSAELAKRKQAAIDAMPDPLQPSLLDQPEPPTGEPARVAETAQAVQSRQEEPPAPAAQPAGELKPPRGILAKKAEREALGRPLTDTGAGVLGSPADPLQTLIQGENDARRATQQAPEPAATNAPGRAEVPQTPGQTAGPLTRPSRWRNNALQAGKVARDMGLDPKGKRLAQIVAEIDAVDAGTNVQNPPQRTAGTEAQAAPVEAPASEGGDAAAAGADTSQGDGGAVEADGVSGAAKKKEKPSEVMARMAPATLAAMREMGIDPDAPVSKSGKLRKDGERMAAEARKMLDGIVPGQPIMSTRDRNLRERSMEKMRKAGELLRQSDELDASKNPQKTDTSPAPVQKQAKSEQVATAKDLREAAHKAATSPKNDTPAPSEAQKEAGNYQKGHVTINGLDISIENPAGSRRRPEWPPLKNHYGYFKGSTGADKDHVDVFLTDRADDPSLPVFVVDQVNRDGSFDEHKIIMGTASEAEARATYLQNYEKGWTGLGAITQMSQDEFKSWVRDPAKTKKPVALKRGIVAKAAEAKAKREAAQKSNQNRVIGSADKSRFDTFIESYDTPQEAGKAKAALNATVTWKNGLRGELSRHIEAAFDDGSRVVLTASGPAFVDSKMRGWSKADIGAYGMEYANWLGSQEQAGEKATPPKPEAPEGGDDRDTFTLDRLNRDTNKMEPVTFERGEYITYKVGSKDQFGEIDGISQARREFSVDGLWHPMGFAYKAERPAAPNPDTVPLSSVIDKVNAKNGEGLTEADRVPDQKPASKTPTVDRHNEVMQAVRDGKANAEQFKASFEEVVANKAGILAELGTKTKAQLLAELNGWHQQRYANENKTEVVEALYRDMVGEYVLGESLSYGMGKGAYEAAVRAKVEATDADKLARYVEDRRAAIAEAMENRKARAAAMENPQTLDDFRSVVKARMMEGQSRKEAFLSLTPEQRIKYDELEAESTREARETRKRAQKIEVRAAGQTTGGEIIATKHTKTGADLYVVQLSDRLSREDYTTVLASAKRMGGWYSSFRGNGAVPGFQFKTRDAADAFLKLAGGDTTDAKAQAEQRRDAFADDRSQSAVERLNEMAEKIEVSAQEDLNRDRKTNTARRARFAASAERAAEAEKALARTMRNIAQAIDSGKAKFLDAVRMKTQVEALTGYVRTAKDNELRAKYPAYTDQEKRRGEPPTAETADFAEFPTFTAFRSDLASLARQMIEVEGTKKLGTQLMKLADDVTDAYIEFAKQPENLQRLSTFSYKRGDDVKTAIFASRDTAEQAIKRSGLTGKAIVLAEKRGVNRVIMSPSEAMNQRIWDGDGDKRITLTPDGGSMLVEAIGHRGDKKNGLTVPWQFQTAHDRRKALARMGIETPSEFRSALREFIALQERATANKVREMELAMVGKKSDGLDFFPTPQDVADQMVEAADIQPDMAVLEPSAGMGHIADRISDAGVSPDVVEMSEDRRDLLTEKGYELVGRDFLEVKGKQYDRIIMNPPFSNRRDAEHVRHAYSLLKPGGRIVAIMGEGVFFSKDKKAQDFQDWLSEVGGTEEKLPAGSFMDPSLPVNTGVSARMVVIDKPEGDTQLRMADPTQQATPAATSTATPVNQAIVESLSDSINAQRATKGSPAVNFQAVEPAEGTEGQLARAIAKTAKRIFNREVVYVRFDGQPLFNGAVSKLHPGKIFVNIDSERPMMAVLGHELLHELAKSNPGVYANLSRRLDRVMRNQNIYSERLKIKYRTQGQPLPADIMEELEADIVGDNFMDPKFWEEMSQEQPGLFRAMANQIIRWLDKVAGQIRRMNPFGTDQYLSDIAEARSAVAEAMREFSRSQVSIPADVTTDATADVQFSLADTPNTMREVIPQAVMERLADISTSQRGFNRWWHRTVGTQLHKAKINKSFGKVYYAVQDFMKDVSRMATLSADLAPDLLPQLDTLSDARKIAPQIYSPKAVKNRKADMKAASDALFDGTLRYTRDSKGNPVLATKEGDKGIVWTTAELKARGMSDEAVKLYQQSRLAINQSLDNLLASDVFRSLTAMRPELLANDPVSLEAMMERIRKAAASDTPMDAISEARGALDEQAAKVEAQIQELKAAIKDRSRDTPVIQAALDEVQELADSIEEAKETLDAKVERIADLKASGYAPLMRFGEYTVDALDAQGNRVYFGMYENQFAANRAARKFRADGLTVNQGVQSKKEFELLKGVSPETAMLFADMMGMEKNAAMQDWLQKAVAQQSALKRHIRRKGIEGFENDASRVVAAFITSNSRAASRALHGLRIQESVENVKGGDVKDEAIALAEYVNNPKEEAQAIRSLLFVNYIGGSVASAMVNLTQTLVQTFPFLSQYGGAGKAGMRISSAMRQALGKISDPELSAAVDRAVKDGVIKPQEVFQLQAEASRTLGSDIRVRAFLALWGSFFQAAEVYNRRVAFIAGYQTAKEQGIANPYAFAENAVEETQGTFNKGNRPDWARGALGSTVFTFKGFTIQYVEFLKRLPPKERAIALGVLVMIAGTAGLPFAGDAEDIIDTVAQQLGYNFTVKDARNRFLVDTFGRGAADFIQFGASPWLPFDVSQRLGMADLLPGTAVLKPSETRKEDQVMEVAGVAGSFVRDILKGEYRPIAVRNLAKAIEMYDMGIYRDTRGRKVIDVDGIDAAFKGIGLQPSNVAAESRAVGREYEKRALYTQTKNRITEQMALGQFEGDTEKVNKARQQLIDWNEKNPDARMIVSMPNVWRRVSEMRKDRSERFIKSAPKEIRSQTREALQ